MVKHLLQENERVDVAYHRHWFYLLKEIVVFTVLAITVPVLIGIAALSLPLAPFIPGSIALLATTLIGLWTLFIMPMVAVVWTDYFLDVLCLTNKRVLDIEQRGLFNRNIASVRYENIQDVTVDVEGIIATFLDFGTIHIQTAGTSREFVLHYVAHPNEVKGRILAARSAARE